MKLSFTIRSWFLSALALAIVSSTLCLAQQAADPKPKPSPPSKTYPKDRIGGLVHDWTRARDYTKAYIDAMPEEAFSFKPTPEMRSFAQQMVHLAVVNYAYGCNATKQTYPFRGKNYAELEDEHQTKAALTKLVMASYDLIIDGLKTVGDARLDERMAFADVDWPMHVYLQLGFEHQTHQRALTAVYLRLKGVKPPAGKFF